MSAPTETPRVSAEDLRDQISGAVIGPADAEYDEARTVFFKGVDRHPAAIALAADASDVSKVVSIAGERGAELAVRAGGHSRAGYGTTEGGIILDLSQLSDVEIADGHAWTGTGIRGGAYSSALAERGLATGLGDTGSVGIGGITLAGGLGFLSRKWGMTIDDLLAAEVVTADGEVLEVDEQNHPDLFWAIRGGGGNFGVATRLKLRTHELTEIVGGMMILPADPGVIAGLVAAAADAPEELSLIANTMNAPPMPFIPEESHGTPIVMALMVYAGGAEDGEQAVAPFRALAKPVADTVAPKTYIDMFAGPGGPDPVHATGTNFFLDSVDAAQGEAILSGLESATAPMAAIQLRVLGGAVERVPTDATAFAHRDRNVMVNVAAMFPEESTRPEHEAWVEQVAGPLRDDRPGSYVGFLGEEDEPALRAAYTDATWDRLKQVKAQYDPENLFRRNQNVPPG